MKCLSLILLVSFSNFALCQITKSEVLGKAEAYYSSLGSFSVKVRDERKSAIDIQSNVSEYYCYVDRKSKVELFNSNKFAYLVKSGKEFDIDFEKAIVTAVTKNKKHWIYYQRFSRFPFINFTFLKKEIHKTSLYIDSTEYSYLLKGVNSFYEFSKANGSIIRIHRSGKDEGFTGGEFFETISFDPIDSDDEEITEKISIVETIINGERKMIESPGSTPESFDLTILYDPNLRWSNFTPGSLTGKKVLIDFFFQGCYPCVKSYPYLVEMNSNLDSNTIIIGIDSAPRDSLTVDEYLKKYNIVYPVLSGNRAKEIAEILRVETSPTMILIDEKGKIVLYHKGFSPAAFRKVSKLLGDDGL